MDTRTTRARRSLAGAVAVVAAAALLTATSPVAAEQAGTGTTDIANGAVTTPKLAKNAVTAKKIKPKAVTRGKLKPALRPMWAVVWSGPTIDRGRGAEGVSNVGASTFQYRVDFARNVSKCAYTAAISTAPAGGAEQIGMVSVAPFAGQPTSVLVVTRDHEGFGAPRGFTVRVDC